jgi:hypothetical protein
MLPILYLLLVGATLVIPLVFPVLFIMLIPSGLIVNSIAIALGSPIDTTYIVLTAGLFQFFLLGLAWDYFAGRLGEREHSGTRPER